MIPTEQCHTSQRRPPQKRKGKQKKRQKKKAITRNQNNQTRGTLRKGTRSIILPIIGPMFCLVCLKHTPPIGANNLWSWSQSMPKKTLVAEDCRLQTSNLSHLPVPRPSNIENPREIGAIMLEIDQQMSTQMKRTKNLENFETPCHKGRTLASKRIRLSEASSNLFEPAILFGHST